MYRFREGENCSPDLLKAAEKSITINCRERFEYEAEQKRE